MGDGVPQARFSLSLSGSFLACLANREAAVYYVASGWDMAGLLIVSILAIAPLAFAGMRLMAGACARVGGDYSVAHTGNTSIKRNSGGMECCCSCRRLS